MTVKLVDHAGEFCTRRNSPGLPALRKLIESALEANTPIEIDRVGVKILTPSFIDELLPGIVLKFGDETVERLVTFRPPLEGFLKEQVTRGLQARRAVKS